MFFMVIFEVFHLGVNMGPGLRTESVCRCKARARGRSCAQVMNIWPTRGLNGPEMRRRLCAMFFVLILF